MSECIAGGNKVYTEHQYTQINGESYKLENTEWKLLNVQPGGSFYKEVMQITRSTWEPNKPKLRECKVWTGNSLVSRMVYESALKQGYRMLSNMADCLPDCVGFIFDTDGDWGRYTSYNIFKNCKCREETVEQFLNGGVINE